METARPRSSRLFDDPLARDFLRGPLRAAADLAAVPVARRIVPALYDLIWPGPRPSAVARTQLIDDTLAGATADGIAQVVLLGAGFDSRAWRLPAIRRARVIEVDHPGTQHAKVAALRRTRQPLELASFTPRRLRASTTWPPPSARPASPRTGQRCSSGKASPTT